MLPPMVCTYFLFTEPIMRSMQSALDRGNVGSCDCNNVHSASPPYSNKIDAPRCSRESDLMAAFTVSPKELPWY